MIRAAGVDDEKVKVGHDIIRNESKEDRADCIVNFIEVERNGTVKEEECEL